MARFHFYCCITRAVAACLIGLICMASAIVPVAYAQDLISGAQNSNEPLEILADSTLEWHQKDKQYIARGNVVATQGDVSIHADILTADYRETSTSAFEIYRLTAAGTVKIVSKGNTAYSDRAVYDVDKGVAVLTGNNIQLVSPDQVVTAEESMEYWVTEGRVSALGRGKVIRGTDTLEADRMNAWLKENAEGKRELERFTAIGNVVITTPDEVLTGQRGEYKASTNIATLNGDVLIRRGPNTIEGNEAEVNLTTNISRMNGGDSNTGSNNGRVRAVFYPESGKK